MSTRKYLKDRKKFFEHLVEKDPNNKSAKMVIDEIEFIFESLKQYDTKNEQCKESM